MKPAEFRQRAVALFGATGWRTKVAKTLGVNRVTVWRWEKGQQAIPRIAQLALEGLGLARMYGSSKTVQKRVARRRKAS